MGLLKLITFPVSAPVSAGKWVLETVLEQAELQYYNEADIQRQLAELETQRQQGEMTAEQADALEDMLFRRLLEARAYHQQRRLEGK